MSPINLNTSSKALAGPSGRAMAQPMGEDLADSLHQHLTMERNASAHYFALAIWFAERELRGFSQFFRQESINEQEHAAKFAEYLIARGQKVLLQALPAPKQDWKSIEEIIAYSFQLEADVTTSLHQLYSIAERSSDMRTTVFLDPTIESQVASEDEFSYILGRVKFAQNQPSAMLIIDAELNGGNIPQPKIA